MFDRLWRRDALRVHLSSHIGVVVASAVVLMAGQPATAQYTSDFEGPLYTGSAAGDILTGQDGFYIPVPGSHDGLVYTYVGNALGLPANPSGGGDQFAGVTGGVAKPPKNVPFARAQRDVVYGDGTGVWTISFDIAATYLGVLPSGQNIGSFSTTDFPDPGSFIALATWTDPDTAANWNADYVWFNAVGTQLTEAVDDPGFQDLLIDHWYRRSTTFNLDTNQILQVSITDLTTNVTVTHSPVGRYLAGGAGGGGTPLGFRLFGGTGVADAEGNTLGFDNISIDLRPDPMGACCLLDEFCVVLTEADCTDLEGTYSGDGTGCTPITCVDVPPACGKGAGPCDEPHDGPGCEDAECCVLVCDIDPLCCIDGFDWTQTCVDIAIDEGCVAGPGQGELIATGGDDSIDGYMDVLSDGLGSCGWAFQGGPDWRDHYNAVGGDVETPNFTATTFLYTDAAALSLTLHDGSFSVWGSEGGMFFDVTDDEGTSDTNGDAIPDTRVVDFVVTGPLSLDVTCTQHVERLLALGGTPVATWTVTYDITNTGGAANFRIVRWADVDAEWVGDALNDIVGTGTNEGTKCDRFAYIGEDGAPNLTITLSTNQPDAAYVGSKLTFDPDCDGPDPPFGFGTDPGQVWDNFGFFDSYINQIAGVGQNIDGESGPSPDDGCDPPHIGTDGSIGLQSTISLGPGEMTTVVYKFTYGAITPDGADCGGGEPCPADLVVDGVVGVKDLLFLLGTWGPCPKKGDCPADLVVDGVVGVKDLLFLLGAWGPCP